MQQHLGTARSALGRASHKLAWSTRERRGATIGAAVGLVCAFAVVPSFGVARGGGGIAGIFLAVPILMLIGALVGARIAVATTRQ